MQDKKPFDDALSIPELEERVADFWENDKTFEKSLEKTKSGAPYTFYDGPPFATGLPHYGHILASTIKDLIPRYQTMSGHFVRRRWGWDCHGLPVEEIVERQLGISGKKQIEEVGIQKFNETCRATVLRFADEWGKMVRRLGRWVEFENSYKTMDRTFMESVWWAFKTIYDKGLVYEGRKVLLYCPRCETPLSNFEVAMDSSYKDVQEESVYVKFKISSEQARHSPLATPAYLLAWTTTPWTLPGNVALAVGKDIDYVRVKVQGEELILAKSRLVALKTDCEIVAEMKGRDLTGLSYEPLFNIQAVQSEKAFKVYPADFVTTEDGTGIVHTAVVYGEDDYKLGLEVGLPVVPLLDEKGKFNKDAPEFIRGEYFKDAERVIKKDLEERGLLFARANHLHSYPHCWRCGTMLFYNAIPAWFVNVQKLKPGLLASNDKEMNWYPAHLKHGRYQKTLESAPDWNISRNRYWGNPIPVWKCESCGENHVMGSVSDLKLEPTTLYFMRHAEAEQNVMDIVNSDPKEDTFHLTEKGKESAKKGAELLKEKGLDLIITSDFIRTKETAEIVSKATGAPVVTDARLREFNTGVWNGKHNSDFDKARPPEGWWKVAPEGGETWTETRNRMMQVVHEITAQHPGKRVLIVSHGDPLWVVFEELNVEVDYPQYAIPYAIEATLTDLHRPYIDNVVVKCEKCGGNARRVPEIFDSWIEAGSMPFAEYHYPFENREVFEHRYPAQFVAEYIAQTRAWFQLMHVMNFALFNKAPVENLLTTGTILAEDGSKMSKSKNNYPDPWLVIDKFGVDTLRFYLMGSTIMQAENLNFSEKDLGNVHRKVTLIIWNVYQYFMTYAPTVILSDSEEPSGRAGDPSAKPQDDKQHVLDRWIRARTKELVIETTDQLDAYDTVKAARAIEKFVDDFSTWYLRRSRGREDSGFFPAFYETLIVLSKVIAPFMPHLAEVIYSNLTHTMCEDPAMHGSVHVTPWPEKEALTGEEQDLIKQMELVRGVASAGLSARKELSIPVRQPLARIQVNKEKDELILTNLELAEILLSELNIKAMVSDLLDKDETNTTIKRYPLPDVRGAAYMYIDTELTPELKLEGLTRNLERFVQELRKTQGFKVGEEAVLHYETSDAEIEKAFAQFDTKKTYISKIEKGSGTEDFESRAKISIERT